MLIFFQYVRAVKLFVWLLATPRCEAPTWDRVIGNAHARKGNVARATSVASCVGAAAGASISTATVAASGAETTGAY